MKSIFLIVVSLVVGTGCSTNSSTGNGNVTADVKEKTTSENKNQVGHNFKIYNNSRF